jgi:DNA-binding MarR family transcriptional regulator
MRDDAAVQAIELVARATVGITTRALAEATPGLDLSLLQWRALLIVGDDPAGARVGRVRDVVGVPLPAASRLVRRLQRRGLVHVERDPDDGRATRVRLTHAGSHTRSTILARRHHLIAEALGQTVLSAEAVHGLFVVAERLERMSRENPAQRTGLTRGPERGTMNETDPKITETPEHPDRYARNDPGSFASGEETTPEKDAEERGEHLGTFAAGEETTPEKDAEERGQPGTFADSEPTA